MIKYSIIIPMYNMENYIEECLNSIYYQKRDDVEVIVIDDGSIDNSSDICMKYSGFRNFKYIYKENSGSMDSWICGVYQANGEYICFLDSDDYLSDNFFSIVDENIEENVDVLIYDYYRTNKYSKIHSKSIDKKCVNLGGIVEVSKIKKDYFSNYKLYSLYRWNKIYKSNLVKDAIKKIKFRVTYFEDLFFGLQILEKAQRIKYICEPIYYYRLRKSSVTHTISEKVFSDNIMVNNELKNLMLELKKDKKSIASMEVYMKFGYVRFFLRTNMAVKRVKISFYSIFKYANSSQFSQFLMYKLRLKWLFKLIYSRKSKKINIDYLFD